MRWRIGLVVLILLFGLLFENNISYQIFAQTVASSDYKFPDPNDKEAISKLPFDKLFEFIKMLETKQEWESLEDACYVYIKYQNPGPYKDRGNSSTPEEKYKYFLEVHDIMARAQANQGKYLDAAQTLRQKYDYLPGSTNIQNVILYHSLSQHQKKSFEAEISAMKQRIEIFRQALQQAKDMYNLIKEAHAKEKFNQDEMKKLQESVKQLQQKLNETLDKAPKLNGIRHPEIVYNATQKKELEELQKIENNCLSEIAAFKQGSESALLELVKKFEITWPGLEAQIKELIDLQTKLSKLQNEIISMLQDKISIYNIINQVLSLKSDLEKLMKEYQEKFNKIIESFMKAEIFEKLKPEEQLNFIKMLEQLLSTNNVIDSNNNAINKLLKEYEDKKPYDLYAMKDEEYVFHLYKHILKRNPDPAGYKHWLEQLKNGMPREHLVTHFFFSKEFLSKVDLYKMRNDQFVYFLYKYILKREPDKNGFYHHLKALESGQVKREVLVQHFMFSDEYLGRKPKSKESKPPETISPATTTPDISGRSEQNTITSGVTIGNEASRDSNNTPASSLGEGF